MSHIPARFVFELAAFCPIIYNRADGNRRERFSLIAISVTDT
jgi:hypothetical protein